ncbi:MAG: prepilin peptidase [Candidatus Omnitrophica bacterium]|jgi:leader peptidase (prepilin peptidase)/N-methyltransferase|nr:prepilin peptidase [Candidatus Omnitrophota bacterium]
MLEKIFVFLFGSIVGSFLNVCIHRMPLEESVVFPASHCPSCKKPLSWYDNIPFISYIFLLGKCRYCKKPISPRYILVELLTALVFLLCFNLYGLSFSFFYYLTFICGLIVGTFVDIKHRIIPDEISIGGIVLGLVFNIIRGLSLKPFSWNWHPAVYSLSGIIIGGGVIYLTGWIFDLIYFKLLKKPAINGETESMGGGDVKLLAMIGAFLGWERALMTFFLAPFAGIIFGVVNMIVKKDHTLPYGPFLALAALASLFFYGNILNMVICY